MECISFVSYNFIFNGKRSNTFVPTRGLRQGDPLSPYLFLFIIDVLSRMVCQALKSRSMSGIKLSRECPKLTHLFFADNSLFFLFVDVRNCEVLRNILGKYFQFSGQAINLNKSSMIFNANVPEQVNEELERCMQVYVVENCGTYLGIPSF